MNKKIEVKSVFKVMGKAKGESGERERKGKREKQKERERDREFICFISLMYLCTQFVSCSIHKSPLFL